MDFRKITASFTKEINLAGSRKKSSLFFTVNEMPGHTLAKENEPFQVMKIGGSICQNAMVRQVNKRIRIDSFEEERLPIFTTSKAFLGFIKSHLRKDTDFLALNFAYPIKPILVNGYLDGILLAGTKDHTFSGLIGERVGKNIEDFIKGKFNRRIKISLANDTVCLLLSGLNNYSPENLAGGIVGTGLNFGYFLNDKKLVNLESHNFDKFTLSSEGKTIDETSRNRGQSLFEKEVAGNWLYRHYNIRKKGQFSEIGSTHELDEIARGKIKGDKNLARELFNHAAKLVACQVSGITNLKKKDMVFVMEGSLFWIGYQFKKTVEKMVKELTPDYHVSFIEVKNGGIIGAAKLLT